MGVLSIILLVLFVIVCLLLIFLVAVQDENSVGVGGLFGGSSDSTFGSGTSKFINKATTTLAIGFIVLALLVAFVNKTGSRDTVLDSVNATEQNAGQATGEWWSESKTDSQAK